MSERRSDDATILRLARAIAAGSAGFNPRAQVVTIACLIAAGAEQDILRLLAAHGAR